MSREELLQKLQKENGIIENAVKEGVNKDTIKYAKKFGEYLAREKDDAEEKETRTFWGKEAEVGVVFKKLTTSQVRKFFGEVKRQQMTGYIPSSFVLLKPKLAYAVGRAEKKEPQKPGQKIEKSKIIDFYNVLAVAIDTVIIEEEKEKKEEGEKGGKAFKNFIDLFEAIVAYHKYAEAGNAQK